MYLASSLANILKNKFVRNQIGEFVANMTQHRWLKSLGPIVLSAFSIFISFIIIQPVACILDNSFSLFANKGIGKIGITVLVITHIFLLLFIAPKKIWKTFISTNFSFFLSPSWITTFLKFFFIFFLLHTIFCGIFLVTGAATFNENALGALKLSLLPRLLFGFVATFFLAWTEELIFRGTVFPLLNQHLSSLPSALVASFIFMAAHDLSNPLNLLTIHWQLGLGLFLLGLFINLIFIITKQLYAGMGAHAGLVFVKVLLRRLPLLLYIPPTLMPWWLDKDLRQAPLIHVVFFTACLGMMYYCAKHPTQETLPNNKNV